MGGCMQVCRVCMGSVLGVGRSIDRAKRDRKTTAADLPTSISKSRTRTHRARPCPPRAWPGGSRPATAAAATPPATGPRLPLPPSSTPGGLSGRPPPPVGLVHLWFGGSIAGSVGRSAGHCPHTHTHIWPWASRNSELEQAQGGFRNQPPSPYLARRHGRRHERLHAAEGARGRHRRRRPLEAHVTWLWSWGVRVCGLACCAACLPLSKPVGCLAAAGFCFEDGVKEKVSPRSAARSPCYNPESACQPIGLWGSVCTAQPLSVRWERKPLGPLDRTATLRQARARLRCLADSSSLFRHGR